MKLTKDQVIKAMMNEYNVKYVAENSPERLARRHVIRMIAIDLGIYEDFIAAAIEAETA